MTPAMVAYYFKDKSGCSKPWCARRWTPLRNVIDASVQEHEPGAHSSKVSSAATWPHLPGAPWIPQLLIREVISRDSPLRAMFVEEFASQAVAVVPARVLEEINAGAGCGMTWIPAT